MHKFDREDSRCGYVPNVLDEIRRVKAFLNESVVYPLETPARLLQRPGQPVIIEPEQMRWRLVWEALEEFMIGADIVQNDQDASDEEILSRLRHVARAFEEKVWTAYVQCPHSKFVTIENLFALDVRIFKEFRVTQKEVDPEPSNEVKRLNRQGAKERADLHSV